MEISSPCPGILVYSFLVYIFSLFLILVFHMFMLLLMPTPTCLGKRFDADVKNKFKIPQNKVQQIN
jgi:hypothetical protein